MPRVKKLVVPISVRDQVEPPIMDVAEVVSVPVMKKYGSREDVFNGKAVMTKGKLTKDDLIFLKGKYMSKKAIARGIALQKELILKKPKVV